MTVGRAGLALAILGGTLAGPKPGATAERAGLKPRETVAWAGLKSGATGIAATCSKTRLPPMAAPRPHARALWLWDSETLLHDRAARARTLEFCRCEGIGVIWMQIGVDRRAGSNGFTLSRADQWPSLLAEAHAAGLRVEALDGSPTYALRPFHHVALGIVDAVLAYNRSVRLEQRFDGLHFDNEPYTLYRWRFPEHRERIVGELLEVTLEAQRRVRTAAGLRFGAALPFWWHRRDDATQEPFGMVTYEGRRQPATFHLIDRLDYVAIMSYRNRATGPNGMIAISRDLLEYADRARAAALYLGVETAAGSTRVWFATGRPREELLARLRARGEDPDYLDPVDGYRTSIFDDGAWVHVGLKAAEGESEESPRLRAALGQVAARYGASLDSVFSRQVREATERAMGVLTRDIEWADVRERPILARQGATHPGFVATAVTPASITFAGRSARDLHEQVAQVERAFAEHASFGGMAFHDRVSLLRLLER